MEEKDTLQRLSDYSSSITEEQEYYNGWIAELTEATNCHNKSEFSVETFNKPVKEIIVKLLYTAYQITTGHVSMFLDIKKTMEELKSHLIISQSTAIKLQAELLEIKSKQLESVHSTKKTAVEAEMKSYSQAVSKTAPVPREESLKKVVQNDVTEEDRSRIVLIFGLKENDEGKLCDIVYVIVKQIEEKSPFEVIQVGRKSADKTRSVSLGKIVRLFSFLQIDHLKIELSTSGWSWR